MSNQPTRTNSDSGEADPVSNAGQDLGRDVFGVMTRDLIELNIEDEDDIYTFVYGFLTVLGAEKYVDSVSNGITASLVNAVAARKNQVPKKEAHE